MLAELGGFLDDATMVGLVDDFDPHRRLHGMGRGTACRGARPRAARRRTRSPTVLGLDHVNCLGDTDGDGMSQEDEAGGHRLEPPQRAAARVLARSEVDPDGYFGYTSYRSPVTIYSNDPGHPQAAFPLMGYADPGWSDPYHWCRLLDATGVPCNPSLLGLPPATRSRSSTASRRSSRPTATRPVRLPATGGRRR